MTEHEELMLEGNDAFYKWEKAKYGDNPCDYVLSDEDRLIWVLGYVEGRKDGNTL